LRISIIQSCYIPWKGFFDLVSRCDEYVIFDSAQFVKRHWHNRNKIRTERGLEWLTIPVISKGRFLQPIQDVEIAEPWAERHWRSIELAYRRSAYFEPFAPLVRNWYERAEKEHRLTEVNMIFLSELAQLFGITTRFSRDSTYPAEGRKSERLLAIAQGAGASHYLSGPSAKSYLDESLFASAGISVEWMSYDSYPPYSQPYQPFEHAVSVLDVIFNTGPEARNFVLPALRNGGCSGPTADHTRPLAKLP
jgi:WbqC-like protein family